MLEILYYPEGHHGPVREYLSTLAATRPKAFARLALDLEVLGAEGLRDKLWELKRLYEGVQYRLFFGIHKGAVWLVHSLEKKSPKTPTDDLAVARKRLREVLAQ